MILPAFSKERMHTLNQMSFSDYDFPMNLKTLWVETIDIAGFKNDIIKETHAHSFFEVHFVFFGTVVYCCGDTRCEVKGGQALVIPSGKHHKLTSCSEDILKTGIAFYLEEGIISKEEIFDFNTDILQCFDQIFSLCDKNDILVPVLTSCKIIEILYSVFGHISAVLPESRETKTDPRFLSAKKFIQKNIDHKITSLQVANECYLSQKQLNRIFLKETGESISKYISSVKIKLAKKKLLETTLSIKEIAFIVGFENEGSFIYFFKKHCGMAPSAFRKQTSDIQYKLI